MLEPVEVIIPDNTILSANAPKPVSGYTETILRMIDVMFAAFAQATPERVNGSPYGTINALLLSGQGNDTMPGIKFTFFGGGHGGNPESDGLSHGNAPISMATIPPVEVLEAAFPIYFSQWALRPDSGGPGRHRGGLGAIYEIVVLDAVAGEDLDVPVVLQDRERNRQLTIWLTQNIPGSFVEAQEVGGEAELVSHRVEGIELVSVRTVWLLYLIHI